MIDQRSEVEVVHPALAASARMRRSGASRSWSDRVRAARRPTLDAVGIIALLMSPYCVVPWTSPSGRPAARRLSSWCGTLVERDIGMVATTFVDNAGITRVKSVPLRRLPQLAAWGVGASTSFDYFRFDDWLAAPPGGTAPVGDLRDHSRPTAGGPAGRAARLGLGARRSVPAGRRAARALQPAAAATAGRRMRPRTVWRSRLLSRSNGWFRLATATTSSLRPAVPRTACRGWSAYRTTPAMSSRRSARRGSGSSSSIPSTPPGSSSYPLRRSRRLTPPTPRCWYAARSEPLGGVTTSAPPSLPRWRPTASATAATCTSACGATVRT